MASRSTQHEDTLMGSADITGDPPPSRPMTPQEMDAHVRRQAHAKNQGAQGAQAPGQPRQPGGGQRHARPGQGDPGTPLQPPQQTDQPPNLNANPFSGYNLFDKMESEEDKHWAMEEMRQRMSAFLRVGTPDFSHMSEARDVAMSNAQR